MPPVIDPMMNEPIPEHAGGNTPRSSQNPTSGAQDSAGVYIKAELDNIEHQNLDLNTYQIVSIPPKA